MRELAARPATRFRGSSLHFFRPRTDAVDRSARALRRAAWLALTTVVLVSAGARSTLAQGIVIAPDGSPSDLRLERHSAEARVEENVAVVTVEHLFANPGHATAEGTFLFPLPHDAQVSRFAMEIDGRELAGELLDAEEARRIYEDIVRRNLDPALLELAEYRTFRARVFPIPGGEKRTLRLRYDLVLPKEGSTVTFTHPLRGHLQTRSAFMPPPHPMPRRETPQAPDEEPSTRSSMLIHLTSPAGLSTIYSPSHEIDVTRPNRREARIQIEGGPEVAGRDFVLYYDVDPSDLGATLLTHRPFTDKPGYFTLLLSPQVDFGGGRVQPKDIVFVLDTSGSMAREKMEQAREALRYSVNRLGDRDRFGIVSFSSDVDRFRNELRGTDARGDALYFIDQLEARGGTNIHAALLSAAELLAGSDNGMVVFLTDGLPSTGVTDEGQIRRAVSDAMPQSVRVFSFGVGYDVNTRLLDGLSREFGAFADYVSPDENIEERVAVFYEKIRHPLLTELRFSIDGADTYAFAPNRLGDLHRGGQIVLTGRYRSPGSATLVVEGEAPRGPETFRFPLRFPEIERDRDFVARLWATRRVGQLLDEIRINGEQVELKNEVVDLAKEFGLVTPYTSYLVEEEEAFADDVRRQAMNGQMDLASGAPAPAAMEKTSGETAVALSRSIRAMEEAVSVPLHRPSPSRITVIGGRLMRLTDKGWVDDSFDAEGSVDLTIRFASEAYFTLLRKYPEAVAFAKLGRDVVIPLNGRYVRVGAEGREHIEEADLERMLGRPAG